MSESTEIANAIYSLAATIQSGVLYLSAIAFVLWAGSILNGSRNKE